ncbi:MAG: M20/M25/M40 family metallo-hydrolase [Ktedonobacterales bacterium]|nr:M20/M25/M40 family metallo-hydrolase [Ktedonobacterales bacterium]
MMNLSARDLPMAALTAEAQRHLVALLRCDTTNPPGNEYLAAAYLRDQLAAEDIEARLIEPAPGRVSVWARLAGSGAARPLLLVSHTDVVPVERAKWTTDPFGGEERDGFIYGRGAVDMKDMLALELTLFLHFARRVRATGQPLRRDLILLAVADEEDSGTHGMQWICEHMPELVAAEYALNEGGGMGIDLGKQRIYPCEMAQKGAMRVTLRAQGAPGHAAVPHGDLAVRRLAQALERLTAAPLPMHVIPTVRRFIGVIAATQVGAQRAMLGQLTNPMLSERVLAALPNHDVANALRAMLHTTASPTILTAGTALNVIPSEASAQVDCRVIPGQTPEMVRGEIARRIGDPRVVIDIDPLSPGYEMPQTALFDALGRAIATHDPGAVVAPYLFPAVSDSRYLAPRGVIAYGFVPHQPEAGVPPVQSLAHGHDERVSVANLHFGLRVLHDTVQDIAG